MSNPAELEQAITALEAQRPLLGQAVVETSLQVLRGQLARLRQNDDSPPALEGERKQVTVMFADISGFTAISERLDPEEVRSLINACFERLGAVITRYDGYIDKFIGDAIMALFGAPVAHENDPERALRAALDMVAALEAFNAEHAGYLPQPLSLHMGINSGLVITGGIGTSRRQDYSVIGDAVNLASRLEGLSDSGEILVGEDTYRFTAPLFDFETLKPARVKGKEKPVRVYRLLGAKAIRGQVRGIEGLASPLVGRQGDLEILAGALDDMGQGRGGLVSIIGEAGLGKTRLVKEARELYAGGGLTWARGYGLSYGLSAGYLAVRSALCNLLGTNIDAPAISTDQALRAEVSELLPERAAEVYPYLAHLLEIPLSGTAAQRVRYLQGDTLHQRILQSAQNYISAKAGQAPLVLVLDDLHWADALSLGLLEALLPLTRQSPLLLLLIYRPTPDSRVWAFHQRIPQVIDGQHRVVELQPLSRSESNELLDNLLNIRGMGEETRRLILDKAEGNPFFLEEVIRSLIDKGAIVCDDAAGCWIATDSVDRIAIPDTLQGVITARVDGLNPDAKRILQIASVVGRTFSAEALAEILQPGEARRTTVLEAHLQELQRLGLIVPKSNGPHLEYEFKHAFSQESIYHSLLHSQRRKLHQQVGEALERLLAASASPLEEPGGDKLDEAADLLAYHFEQSRDKDRALKYFKQAVTYARRTFAHHKARDMNLRALALLDHDEHRRRWDLLASLEQILDYLGQREQQADTLVLMQTLAELLADDRCLATSHNRRSRYFDKISEYRAAAEAAEAGLLAARQSGDRQLEAWSLNLLALAAWRRFDYLKVQEYAGRALDALRIVEAPATRTMSLLHLGRASYRLGQYDAAIDYVQAAAESTQHAGKLDSDAEAHLILGWIYQRLGDYEKAERNFQEALEIWRVIGDRYGEATALSHLGWLAYDQGRYRQGPEYCQKALDISRAVGDRENEAYSLSGMALNYEKTGQAGQERARSLYQKALAIHRSIGATTLAVFDQTGLARIALAQNDLPAARAHIMSVVEWITAGNAQRFWDPWIIYQSTCQILSALSETDVAETILNEAYHLLQQRAGQISDGELRSRFLNRVAINRAITEAWQRMHTSPG
ncbi:MAG: adenylate/guanylate cyclase domain-containing protein [Anaerolineae bacterium]